MPQIANGDTGASARAMLNAVLPQAVAFATAVPLDGRKVMAAASVTGALAFAPAAGPALGSDCYVRLTADGAHAPSFAGFTEHGASAGYLNVAGAVNLVRFWHDGVTSWFAVTQAASVVALAMSAAAVPADAATHVVVTFDRDMNQAVVPAASAFTLANSGGADTVTAAAWTGARTLQLTASRAALATDATITLGYAPPGASPLADTNGNLVAGSTIAVTNNVAAAGSANRLQLATRGAKLDVVTADGAGFDYGSSSATNYNQGAYGYPASSLPAGADGWVQSTAAGAAPSGPIMGVCTAAAPTDYSQVTLGIFIAGASYAVLVGGNPGTPSASVAVAAGDLLRVTRAGGTGTCAISKDNATSWTPIWSGALATGALRPYFETGTAGDGGRILLPTASANVA